MLAVFYGFKVHIRQAGKPGSVLDSHSSRHAVAGMLKQPTRMLGEPRQRILFGLAPNGVWPATRCCQRHGALLPHHFTLTCAVLPRPSAVMLSVPLSVASRRPAVSRHSALRSPDFPPRKHVTRRLSGLLMCVPIITQTGLFLINANWDLPEFNIATQQKRLYLNDGNLLLFFY